MSVRQTVFKTMNAKERQIIQNNIDLLSQLIDLNSIIPLVLNKNIFTQHMINDILKIEPEMDRKKVFLQDLTRRGPEAFEAFVEILFGTNQMEAGSVLRPDTFERGLDQQEVISNIVSNSPPDAGGGGLSGGGDSRVGNTIASIENQELMLRVMPSKEAMTGVNIYHMISNPRGFCFIINNIDFHNNVYPKRIGSETEANRLRDVFRELHFTVDLKNNLTKDEILAAILQYSKKADLRKHDAFILIVLSHGHSGYVVGSDGFGLQFEDIVKMLNNENCPQLIGKPKLFFFNCCRGDSRDSGPNFFGLDIDKKAVSDAVSFEKSKIPLANDLMICFSTVDGYVSWRNEETGSWFGTALSYALMKHSHDKELHHILTIASDFVNNKVTLNGEKQVMEHTYRGFRKLFYFNPGITETPNT